MHVTPNLHSAQLATPRPFNSLWRVARPARRASGVAPRRARPSARGASRPPRAFEARTPPCGQTHMGPASGWISSNASAPIKALQPGTRRAHRERASVYPALQETRSPAGGLGELPRRQRWEIRAAPTSGVNGGVRGGRSLRAATGMGYNRVQLYVSIKSRRSVVIYRARDAAPRRRGEAAARSAACDAKRTA